MSSPFSTGLRPPPSHQPPAPPAAPPQPPAPGAEVDTAALSGRVIGKFSQEPLCTEHFPAGPELTRLAFVASSSQPQPFVGRGDPYTALSCACLDGGEHLAAAERFSPPWRLGDHLVHLSRPCLTGAHDSCRDATCECECQGSEARALTVASDDRLAEVLAQIAAGLGQGSDARLDAAMEAISTLTAKVRELEGGSTAAPACGGTKADGSPCKGRPGEDGFCAAHKP